MAENKEEKKPKTGTPLKKEETIEVNKAVLEGILEKQKLQDEKALKQDAEIERLTAAADIKRLSAFDQEHAGELIKTSKVAVMNYEGKDRIVVGWKSTKDYVHFENGVHKYEQMAEYTLDTDEGEKPIVVEMDQRNWYQEITLLTGEVIKETSTPDGKATKVLRFKDGKELELDIVFLNP